MKCPTCFTWLGAIMIMSILGCNAQNRTANPPSEEGRQALGQPRGVDPLRAVTEKLDFSWVGEPARSVEEAGRQLEVPEDPKHRKTLLTWLGLRPDEASQTLLRTVLSRPDIRQSVDPGSEVHASYLDLRLSWVIAALASNPSAPARTSLEVLSHEAFVNQEIFPQILLIRAFAAQKPPSARALEFWRERAGPGSVTVPDVLLATATNETDPALEVWAGIWRNTAHPVDLRMALVRQIVFPLRNRERILATIEHLLPQLESKELQKAMVEVVLADRDRWGLPDAESATIPQKPNSAAKAAKHRIQRWATGHLGLGG
jgi:hypothetical protein